MRVRSCPGLAPVSDLPLCLTRIISDRAWWAKKSAVGAQAGPCAPVQLYTRHPISLRNRMSELRVGLVARASSSEEKHPDHVGQQK